MRTISLAVLLSASAVLAQTTAGDVKKETGEAVDATKRYANEKKEDFEARMEARYHALKEDVVRLKDKTKNGADATAKDLDARAKKVEGKLSEVKKASGSAWSKLKGGVESAVDELDKGVQSAKAK